MFQKLVIYLLGASIAALGFGEYLAAVSRIGSPGISGCLGLGLSGIALLLAARPEPVARRLSTLLSAAALIVGALLVSDYFLSLNIRLDPAQPASLLGGTAVALVGLTQLLLQRINSRPHMYLAAISAGAILLIGILGLFLQLTDLSLLLADRLRPTLRLGTSASMSVLLLSAASFAILISAPEARRYWNEREDRWIAAVSMLSVTAVVLAIGLAGASIFMRHSVKVFSHTLQNSVAANATMVENILHNARHQALEVVGVARDVVPQNDASDSGLLERLANVPELGIHSIRRAQDLHPPASAQRMRVELLEPEGSALVWDGEWLLETRIPGARYDLPSSEFIIEIRIEELGGLVLGSERRTGTSEALVICAPRGRDSLDCFPSVLSRVPYTIPAESPDNLLPIARARAGEAGVTISRDHFGNSVIAAYRPVGSTGLLISEKIAAAELLKPVQERFWWLVLTVVGLLTTGVVLLPRLVQPLVTRLVEARARLHAVLDNIPDAVVTTGADGRILSINAAAEAAFGYSNAQLKGESISRIAARTEADPAAPPLELHRLAADRGPAQQIVGRHSNGGSFPAELRVGEFELQRQTLFVSVIRDNTEKHRSLQALAASREMFRALVENLPDLVIRFNAQLCCIYASPSLQSLFGIEPNDVLAKTVAELRDTPGFPEALLAPLPQVLTGGRELSAEFSLRRGSETRYYHTRFVPESGVSGQGERLLCVTRDVTAVRQAELVLREVITHHANLLEQERKEIAREVHDELGQVLTAIKSELGLMRMRSGGDGLDGSLRRVQDLADRAIHTVRDVVRALRPSTLDLGIVYALQWLSRDFEQRTHVICTLQTPDSEDLELDDFTATHLFRIVQESLTNIERHARADEVRISLIIAGQDVRLDIFDNGQGFDAECLDRRSFGLLGIKERAMMIGGRALISSEPGKGTHVVVHAPLSQPASTRHDSYSYR